jgi:hypothetical protein
MLPVNRLKDRCKSVMLVISPMVLGIVPFRLLPLSCNTVMLGNAPTEFGIIPVILLLLRSRLVSFVSDPKLDGMVPFKPLPGRTIVVMSPFLHVTHAKAREVGSPQFLPPHEHGSSLSRPHCFQVFGSPGKCGVPPVAS